VAELRRIGKAYHKDRESAWVLRALDLTIQPGEFVAIVGASGVGKSTLLHILGCLDLPDEGEYRLGGVPVTALADEPLSAVRNRRIGFVFQTFNLIPDLTVLENVELPLVYAGVTALQRRARAVRLLERVGLRDRLQHLPSELSGGQMQRAAIARALVNEPALILADEPTGNLDPASAREIMNVFQMLRTEGRTIVMVTHDHGLLDYAERVLRLQDGRLVTEA
jgi:putative ABC transport system ATP-binding protein